MPREDRLRGRGRGRRPGQEDCHRDAPAISAISSTAIDLASVLTFLADCCRLTQQSAVDVIFLPLGIILLWMNAV